MLSITNALNYSSVPAHKFSLVINIGGNFDQLIHYRVQSCCNKYIHSVCIKFVNTLPWAVLSVDVYKSDTDLMYVLQPLLTYSQAAQSKIKSSFRTCTYTYKIFYVTIYIVVCFILMVLYEMYKLYNCTKFNKFKGREIELPSSKSLPFLEFIIIISQHSLPTIAVITNNTLSAVLHPCLHY